jgi:hypothetical protein
MVDVCAGTGNFEEQKVRAWEYLEMSLAITTYTPPLQPGYFCASTEVSSTPAQKATSMKYTMYRKS